MFDHVFEFLSSCGESVWAKQTGFDEDGRSLGDHMVFDVLFGFIFGDGRAGDIRKLRE